MSKKKKIEYRRPEYLRKERAKMIGLIDRGIMDLSQTKLVDRLEQKINEIIKVVNAMERHLMECAVLGRGEEDGMTVKYFKEEENQKSVFTNATEALQKGLENAKPLKEGQREIAEILKTIETELSTPMVPIRFRNNGVFGLEIFTPSLHAYLLSVFVCCDGGYPIYTRRDDARGRIGQTIDNGMSLKHFLYDLLQMDSVALLLERMRK